MDELLWNHLVGLDGRVRLLTSWRTSRPPGEFHPEHVAPSRTDLSSQ